MKVKLFGSRLSPYVEKVVRALELKGIEYELFPPKSPGDFKKWNPQVRKMPVMEVEGERTYDSTFILRRLDELAPEPPLVSKDPATAAAQRQLEDWADESLYWYLMALRWTEKNGPRSLGEILSNIPPLMRPLVGIMLKRQVGSTPGVQGLGRLPDDILVRELSKHLDDLVTILGDRSFFYAERPSCADLAVYGMLSTLNRAATPEGQAMIAEREPLVQYMRRVEAVCEGAPAKATTAA